MTYETKMNAKNGAFFYKERKRKQRTPHSFIKNEKERKKRRVHFYKERKRTQRTPHSFIKNGKECKKRRVLLYRTRKNTRTLRSFEKNRCPSLDKTFKKLSYRPVLLGNPDLVKSKKNSQTSLTNLFNSSGKLEVSAKLQVS